MRELLLFGKPLMGSPAFISASAGINWALRILGKTVDAAPLTSPYLADTGLGERGSLVVVETDGSFDADGTKINFTAQTTPVWGDQYIRDAAGQPRVRGLMGAGRIIIDDVTKQLIGGLWNDAIADVVGAHGVRTVSSAIRVQNITGTITLGISIANGDQIDWLVIARAIGSYIWVSINDGNWQLVWWFDVDATATLYSGFTNLDATGSVNLLGAIVVPESFVPVPVVSDDYSLIPTIVDSSSNGLEGTPERVGLDGSNAAFQPPNSRIDLYSTEFNDFFDGQLGSIVVRAKVSSADVWTNGASKDICRIAAGANDQVTLQIPNVANRMRLIYEADGTTHQFDNTSFSPAGIFTTGCTWNKVGDVLRGFTEGTQFGSDTSITGTWTNPLSPTLVHIGAASNVSTNNMDGTIYDFIFAKSEISIANMASLDTKLLAETLTSPDLDGYFGAGNWLWYQINQQNAIDGLGDLEASVNGATFVRDGRTFSSEANKRYNGAAVGGRLLVDGDMEAVGVGDWTAVNSATLTKETADPHGGTQVLRVARNGVNDPVARQAILTTGKIIHIAGWARSDGNAKPKIHDGFTNFFVGTTSTSWQEIDVVGRAGSTLLSCQAQTSTGVEYAELDDMIIVEYAIADLLDLTNTGQSNHYMATNATIIDNTQGGVGVAWDSGKLNGLLIYYDRLGDEVVAEKWLSGVFDSEIMRVAKTYSAAADIRVSFTDIDADGTYDMAVWYDKEFVATVAVSDAAIIGNTYAGLFGFLEEGFAEKELAMLGNEGTKYAPYFVGVFPTGFGFSKGFSLGFK